MDSAVRKTLMCRGTTYFQQDYKTWDIIEYLKYTILPDQSCYAESARVLGKRVELVLDTYIKELRRIAESIGDSNRCRKAKDLIDSYHPVCIPILNT